MPFCGMFDCVVAMVTVEEDEEAVHMGDWVLMTVVEVDKGWDFGCGAVASD